MAHIIHAGTEADRECKCTRAERQSHLFHTTSPNMTQRQKTMAWLRHAQLLLIRNERRSSQPRPGNSTEMNRLMPLKESLESNPISDAHAIVDVTPSGDRRWRSYIGKGRSCDKRLIYWRATVADRCRCPWGTCASAHRRDDCSTNHGAHASRAPQAPDDVAGQLRQVLVVVPIALVLLRPLCLRQGRKNNKHHTNADAAR